MAPKRSLPQASTSAPKRKKTAHEQDNRVLALETELTQALENSTSLNPIVDLISLASSDDAPTVHKALYALYRLCVNIINKGLLTSGVEDGTEAAVVKAWLVARWDEYVDLLSGLLRHTEPSIRTSALEIMMSLVKPLSTALSKRTGQPRMDGTYFRKAVRALLVGPSSISESSNPASILTESDVRYLFLDKWLTVHDDVRWFFLREATELLQHMPPATPATPLSQNLLALLERLNTMPTVQKELNEFWVPELAAKPAKPGASATGNGAEDEPDPSDWLAFFDEPEPTAEEREKPGRRTNKLSVLQSLHYLPSHRAVFSDCWLALLPHLNTPALASKALNVLHKAVLPHFTRPLRLMDWISGCVDHGGVIGLLALNALFTLMRDHNLDYPDFYKRLYGFLTRDVLHLKYRARFFRLTELFLSSTHLPVALLASFIKRLSRLSLSAPPAAIVMIIPFTYNILKQHPSLMPMIHRETTGDDADPFKADESDPMLTNAIASSLWELNSHREHYLASVSTMAKILSEPFTKPSYALEDFLDHTYGTMFEAEIKRKIKYDPALAVDYEGQIFPSSMLPMGAEKEDGSKIGDVVADLWGFGVIA
ncbi:CBF-domain-containing protein [Calocera viscosa TUFC12733]|uniref:CBF-domain-containing protein n=1 Tax=Calocera viscosa (strain TUFC12733) TaxID=1330018 RepID=A0A167KC13_CALVF|nr:CBF-domain-containing protein [Calocera viscosa TUFC12733]